ncbi:uncharacterized protein LOC108164984 [Drosophila miranda]|uniref:uncharacterized protein LOC108164984 n=1 Tax=Drosophila miranda TaxID=7229 RepID=UPI0007E672AB|nr:uncharacterized protein LOC108164984 [Drosophila miranda]
MVEDQPIAVDDYNTNVNRESSDDQFLINRKRRNAVHFANVGEFLSSLNIRETGLTSLKGLRTLSLEHYKSCMLGPEERDRKTHSSGCMIETEIGQPPADGL